MWVTWNVRGLGRAEKRKSVRLSLERVRPQIILLQETKLSDDRDDAFRGWLRSGLDFCTIPAMNAAGGLATMWKKNTFVCEGVTRGADFLLTSLRIIQTQELVMVVNVYGPQEVIGRERMFYALGELLENVEGRVVVGGDFNAILNDGERRGAAVEDRKSVV